MRKNNIAINQVSEFLSKVMEEKSVETKLCTPHRSKSLINSETLEGYVKSLSRYQHIKRVLINLKFARHNTV